MNTVESLLRRPFLTLSQEERLIVKRLGPHQPYLNLEQISTSKEKTIKRKFRMDWYMKKHWLCGSESMNALFCFPCLLFGGDLAWTKTGIKDLKHLSEKIRKHESCSKHINTSLQLVMLGGPTVATEFDEFYQRAIKQHNQQVDKNRYVLSKLLDCMKFCGYFEIPFQDCLKSDGPSNVNSSSSGILLGLMNFLGRLDSALENNLKSPPFVRLSTRAVQNDLLASIMDVCQEIVRDQITKSPFLSLQFVETSDGSADSRIAIFCRFIVGVKVIERFWGFLTVSDLSAPAGKQIRDHLEEHIKGLQDKIVAQSFDGASATRKLHLELQQYYPCAYYIHSYSHELFQVVQQVASKILEVRIFFAELSMFPACFAKSRLQSSLALDQLFQEHLSQDISLYTKFSTKTVNTVYEHKHAIIQYLEAVQLCPSSDVGMVRDATALLRTLDDPSFIFWLTFFNKVLHHLSTLHPIAHNHKGISSAKVKELVSEFESNILEVRDELMSCKHEPIIDAITDANLKKRKKVEFEDYSEAMLATEVCGMIIDHVKERFLFSTHFEAIKLLRGDLFEGYVCNFPQEEVDCVADAYPMLDKEKLQTELLILYQNEKASQFKGIPQLLQAIFDSNRNEILSETVKLIHIVLTLPITPVDSEKMSTTHTRVKTFLKNLPKDEDDEVIGAFTMLSAEKNMISTMPGFNQRVIEKFAQQAQNQTDFLYK